MQLLTKVLVVNNVNPWAKVFAVNTVQPLTKVFVLDTIAFTPISIQIPQHISPATFIGKHVHQLIYAIPVATIDSYKFSFYPRSIKLWNQLPSTAVFAASPTAFQAITLSAVIEMKFPIGSKILYLISAFFPLLFCLNQIL